MADFGFSYPNSGTPWNSGGATINKGIAGPQDKTLSDRETIVRTLSQAQPGYFNELNTRFLYDPSGWNQ